MLKYAVQRAREAEQTKTKQMSWYIRRRPPGYNAAMGHMLENKLNLAINKSQPYFELRARYYIQWEHLKKSVEEL